MGLKIKDIIVKEQITIPSLKDKILVVDSMNVLYQFLTTIRGPDGAPFTNSKGNITSHLIGLFNRTTSLMEQGLKLVFVFDGKAPDLKQKTWDKREAQKKKASLLHESAMEIGDTAAMRKYAGRSVKLSKEMIEDAKEMISLLGLPIVQSPSEGEAQASFMVARGDAYACVSQDYDNLVFGCPRLIRNLSIFGKKKRPGKFAYEKTLPEQILLNKNLEQLGIDGDELIVLAILIGTDYNPSGIKGIGQKKGLKLVKEAKGNFDQLFEKLNWAEHNPDLGWKQIFDTIKHIPTTTDYNIVWQEPKIEQLMACLVDKHEFSKERTESKLQKLLVAKKQQNQKGLSSFF